MGKWTCVLLLLVVFTARLNAQSDLPEHLCFSEEPVEHHDGIFLAMTWQLTIPRNGSEGVVEILGYQTWVKMKVDVTQDELTHRVIFESIIEGELFDSLLKGDTLFSMIKTEKGLLTDWNVLNPRLKEEPAFNKVCFVPCNLD